MKRFLFRQKFRFEKGLCVMPVFNFVLLTIAASDRIQRAMPALSTSLIVVGLLPLVLCMVWVVGYALSRPTMQAAEDAAMGDMYPWRRAIGKRKE
jgi:hypothetical protein